MHPSTRMLMDALSEEGQASLPTGTGYEDVARVPHDDPRLLTMQLRRKHQLGLLRKMLEDAGYGDLARATSFRNERLEDDL